MTGVVLAALMILGGTGTRLIDDAIATRMLRYIEAVGTLPEGSLVIAPTQGGMPLLIDPRNR
jgi:hypothetical protein